MNIWNFIALNLHNAGCSAAFGIPADEAALLDACVAVGMKTVIARDQRVAASAAAAFALSRREPTLLALNCGPSFSNALPALLEAASLCSPIIVISNRVPVKGTHRGGFQTLDQPHFAKSFAKWSMTIDSAPNVVWALERALFLSINGRPGLVFLEVPDELQEVDESGITSSRRKASQSVPSTEAVTEAAHMLEASLRPLIIFGGGARSSNAGPIASSLAADIGAALFATASGRSGVDESGEFFCGLVGLYCTPPLQSLLQSADLLVLVGTRLEETARMNWLPPVECDILQIDVSEFAFGSSLNATRTLIGDAAETLRLISETLTKPEALTAIWRKQIHNARESAFLWARSFNDREDGLVKRLIAEVSRFYPNANYAFDNGLNDIMAYHWPLIQLGGDNRAVAPGEQTMMGFALMASIGLAAATPQVPTVVFCGDGAFTMSASALLTAQDYNNDIVIVLFDNKAFGWPKYGRLSGGEDTSLTEIRTPFPFKSFVESIGGHTFTISDMASLQSALESLQNLGSNTGIVVLHVILNNDSIPPGVELLSQAHA